LGLLSCGLGKARRVNDNVISLYLEIRYDIDLHTHCIFRPHSVNPGQPVPARAEFLSRNGIILLLRNLADPWKRWSFYMESGHIQEQLSVSAPDT
jgi:hypothetical protein